MIICLELWWDTTYNAFICLPVSMCGYSLAWTGPDVTRQLRVVVCVGFWWQHGSAQCYSSRQQAVDRHSHRWSCCVYISPTECSRFQRFAWSRLQQQLLVSVQWLIVLIFLVTQCLLHAVSFCPVLQPSRHSPIWGRGTPLSLLVHLLPHLLPFFSLSFIGFTYFLLSSIPSLSTRIVPLRFQAGGRRKRPNLGLVCCV